MFLVPTIWIIQNENLPSNCGPTFKYGMILDRKKIAPASFKTPPFLDAWNMRPSNVEPLLPGLGMSLSRITCTNQTKNIFQGIFSLDKSSDNLPHYKKPVMIFLTTLFVLFNNFFLCNLLYSTCTLLLLYLSWPSLSSVLSYDHIIPRIKYHYYIVMLLTGVNLIIPCCEAFSQNNSL